MNDFNVSNYVDYLSSEFQQYNWCPDNIFDRSRKPKSELVRFAFYFFIDKYFSISSYKIGKVVNRDHSAILNGIKKYKQWIDDPKTFGNKEDRKWFFQLYLEFIQTSSFYFDNEKCA